MDREEGKDWKEYRIDRHIRLYSLMARRSACRLIRTVSFDSIVSYA